MTRQQMPRPPTKDVPVLPTWMARGRESGLDSETAVQLRAYLSPLFEQSESWGVLCERLSAKGFRLAVCGARLVLVELHSGQPICTTRALGQPLAALSERLGRLSVRASGGVAAFGDVRH